MKSVKGFLSVMVLSLPVAFGMGVLSAPILDKSGSALLVVGLVGYVWVIGKKMGGK